MKAYFVTATDTGVGKTTVSAALLAAAHRRGLRALAVKPVESGCADGAGGTRWPADAALLRAAAGGEQPLTEVCPFPLVAPLAPAHAARREGKALVLDALVTAVERVAARAPDLLLVEGAGGLLVPLTDDATNADLAAALGYPLLVVARDGLGTINHASLTILECSRRGLRVHGVVLSSGPAPTAPPADVAENLTSIARLGGDVPCLGHLPHLASVEPAALATAAARHLALDRLLS